MPAADNVLYDAATQQLDSQFGTADALDTKAATILSVASTIAAIVPALLPLGRGSIEFTSWTAMLLVLGIAVWAGELVLFWRAYSIGDWSSGPMLDELEVVVQQGGEYARHWAALAYSLAVRENKLPLEQKAVYLAWLMRLFVAEVLPLLGVAGATFAP